MASRSLNKVCLIGNLTRDPELRYTPQGTAVCTLGLATNRSWATEGGERKEETEFHRLVAWNKLAEICSQFLAKGRRIYAEGRLQTRQWTAQDGSPRQTTEIILSEMIILDSRRQEDFAGSSVETEPVGDAADSSGTGSAKTDDQSLPADNDSNDDKTKKAALTHPKKAVSKKAEKKDEAAEISEDEIPF
ncbi:MAG: single-stranded DNA-binding protein [Candidatus Pacebacteria bacterium]|nr:single-stranded DNA-binding protein [Candidatus Paceibacterota bacterium]